MRLWFVETQTFTKRIERLGPDQDLRALQEELLGNPEAGDVGRFEDLRRRRWRRTYSES
jgi:hypothetical protein